MSLQRLRTDFRFATITLLGSVMVVAVLPFAAYRFVHHEPYIGLFDLCLVGVVVLGVAHLWRGGNAARIGLALMALLDASFVLVTALPHLSVTQWVYPLLVANYLILSRKQAVLLSVATLAGVLLLDRAIGSALAAAQLCAAAMATSLFAFMFADRAGRQHERLEALATLDALTGAFNRRAMSHEMQRAIDAARRMHATLGIAVLDLDHFKRINDAYGHDAGDAVLVAFARLVNASTRRSDRFFRLGGEEFMLLLPGTDIDTLQELCESLRVTVASKLRVHGERVTVSIGAAQWGPQDTLSGWLSRADAAMYRAKREGRDRVVVDVAGAEPMLARDRVA